MDTGLNRILTLISAVGIAGWTVWRSVTFVDATDSTECLTPVMCSLFAMIVLITGLALACDRRETET